MPSTQKLGGVLTDRAKDFFEACQVLRWTHDSSLTVQKPVESQKELVEEYNRKRQQRWSKVPVPKNGGTLRWNVTATSGRCTRNWPLARQHTRNDLVDQVMDPFIPSVVKVSEA